MSTLTKEQFIIEALWGEVVVNRSKQILQELVKDNLESYRNYFLGIINGSRLWALYHCNDDIPEWLDYNLVDEIINRILEWK